MTTKGGSNSQISGYKYYMAVHFGIARGPVNELTEIRVGDLPAWQGNQTVSGDIAINQPNLFGGDQKEGGIVGSAKLLLGEPTQVVDSLITDNIEGGFPVPGWRGVSTLFYYGLVSTNNPYPKVWKFRANRQTAGWDTPVWEPALALINLTSSPITLISFNVNPASGNTLNIGEVEVAFFTIVSEPGPYVQIGPDAEATAAAFVSMLNSQSEDIYDVVATANGSIVQLQFPVPVPVTYGVGSFVGIATQGSGIKAMNGAHIIYECLTNNVWGRGLPESMLDATAFKAAAEQLFAEQFGLCMKWSRQDDIDRFVSQVLGHIGAALFINRQTGLVTLKLLRDDYDHEALSPFTFENGLLDIIEDDASSNDTTYNEMVVTYIDPITGNQGSIRVQNLASFQALGTLISTTSDYPGIPTAALAARVAQRDLQINSGDIRRMKIKFDRVAWNINPGDVFKISVPSRGIQNLILRAGEIEDGPLEDETITITAMQDVFSLPDAAFVTPQPSYWTPPDKSIRVVETRVVDEMTYFDLSGIIPPGELGVITTDTGILKVFAKKPSGATVDYILADKTSLETTYVERTIAGFDAVAELSGSLSIYATTVNFSGGTDLALVTATPIPALIVRDDDHSIQEYVNVTDIDLVAGEATIVRGCIDTVPHVFVNGDKIWFQTDMPTSDFIDRSTGEILNVKLLSRTSSEKLDLLVAPTDILEIGSRQGRPYPPGNLQINGVPFGNVDFDASGDLVFTWTHRDRLTQANFMLGHTAGSTGPEAGTTYTLRVYNVGGTLLRTEDGITGTTFTYTSAMHAADGAPSPIRFEFESERDGLASWQHYDFTLSSGNLFTILGQTSVQFTTSEDPLPAFSISGTSTAVFEGIFTPFFMIASASEVSFVSEETSRSFSIGGTSEVEFVSLVVSIAEYAITSSTTVQFIVDEPTDTFNPADKAAEITLSNGDLDAEITSSPGGYRGVRSVGSRTTGKYHFEIEADAGSTGSAHYAIGIANASADLNNYAGSSAHSIGWFGSGSVWHNASSVGTPGGFANGDILEIEVDLDNDTIKFRNNNSEAWSADFDISGISGPKFIFWESNQLNHKIINLNTGSVAFDGAMSSGFSPWG